MLLGIPKVRGFRSPYAKMAVVNVSVLGKKFKDGDKINPKALLEKRLIDKMRIEVKILGEGELTKKLIIEGCAVSKSARGKIEKVGGKVL
jgi:large subunit ribosomal protein L15